MNKDFKPFSFIHVRTRRPFYARCSKCGAEIGAYYPTDVEKKAQSEGWVYDNDIVLCGECKQSLFAKTSNSLFEGGSA